MAKTIIEFEHPIEELQSRIKDLKLLAEKRELDLTTEIDSLQREKDNLIRKIFANLSAWQKIQIARHPNRPKIRFYLQHIFDEFIELSGDRTFRDDPAIVCGFARVGDRRVLAVGTDKGEDIEHRIKCNFGCPHPEAYRKANHKFRLAEKFNLPIVTFIDTPGAFPGIEAEERNQSQAIAENIALMSDLKVPIISIVTGEGGSGGALAIGLSDRLYTLEYSYYSVISPEGCAAILWKDAAKAPEAAEALQITSAKLKELGVADDIIPEPLGGAHRNPAEMAETLRQEIITGIEQLSSRSLEGLLEDRYCKYRNIGKFEEGTEEAMNSSETDSPENQQKADSEE